MGAKKIIEPEPVKPTTQKVITSIAEKLAQRKGSVTLSVFGFVSKRPSGAKSGLTFERLITMKSGKVDSATKVAPRPVLLSAVTDSSTEKGKSARMGSCERSTESEARKFLEVCALLQANLFEDIDACAKFVDSVRKVVVPSYSFVKCTTYSRSTSLIATMHKTFILVVESMCVDQDAVKCAKRPKWRW
ncbi:hypothetical protein ACFX12_000203 [Malus domestica]